MDNGSAFGHSQRFLKWMEVYMKRTQDELKKTRFTSTRELLTAFMASQDDDVFFKQLKTDNPAIRICGWKLVLDTMYDVLRHEVVLVSLGSGVGTLELLHAANIDKKRKQPNWIELLSYKKENGIVLSDVARLVCVDPSPTDWCRQNGVTEPLVSPTYKLARHLAKQRPDLVGNCNLLLNWIPPTYDAESFSPIHGPGHVKYFDVQAIRELKPQQVFVIYELGHGAGCTEKFHEYISTQKEYILDHLDEANRQIPYIVNEVHTAFLLMTRKSPEEIVAAAAN